MFATFITLVIISFVVAGLRDLARQDGAKILAALQGHSGMSEPRPARPIVVRFSPRCTVEEPALPWPALRAAA